MPPVDQFLRSVQDSFAENRATNLVGIGVVLAAACALGWAASAWLRPRRERRRRDEKVRAIAARARLSEAQLHDLQRIAEAGAAPLLDVMTVVGAFEHATAKLLAREPPVLRPEPRSEHARVRELRLALGFSPLSPHLWLVTTRELVVGDAVSGRGHQGQVAEVSEASFAIDWPPVSAPAADTGMLLTIDRPDDARYIVRSRVLKAEPPPIAAGPGSTRPGVVRVFFAHDEQPERQQQRAYMRLRVPLAARVQILEQPGGDPGGAPFHASAGVPPSAVAATIVDVSAGGLALNVSVPPDKIIARGTGVRCWFALDTEAVFDGVSALVVGSEASGGGAGPGEQHLHLAFTALEDARRDRLAAAVARHEVAARPNAAR